MLKKITLLLGVLFCISICLTFISSPDFSKQQQIVNLARYTTTTIGATIIIALIPAGIYWLFKQEKLPGLNMQKIIACLPLLFFILMLAISYIDHGFSVMYETYHPWYTPYTSKAFAVLTIFFMPAIYLCTLFQIMPSSIMGMAIWLMYSICMSASIYGIFGYVSSKLKSV